MNPNATEREKELFNEAVRAYQEGDIVTLQKIYNEVFNGTDLSIGKKELSYDELAVLCDKIKDRITTVKKEIDEIHKDFPFNIKDFLDDADAVSKKRKELEGQIRNNEETLKHLMVIYEQICEEMQKIQNSKC